MLLPPLSAALDSGAKMRYNICDRQRAARSGGRCGQKAVPHASCAGAAGRRRKARTRTVSRCCRTECRGAAKGQVWKRLPTWRCSSTPKTSPRTTPNRSSTKPPTTATSWSSASLRTGPRPPCAAGRKRSTAIQ